MSFQTFRENPKSYLSGHLEVRIAQTAHAFNAVRAGPDLPVPGGGQSRQYHHKGTAPFVTGTAFMNIAAVNAKTEAMKFHNVIGRQVGLSQKLSRLFSADQSGGDVGVRWLPYALGFVTYMEVDNAATFMLTGELSGCTVAVGAVGTYIYYFHSFAPNGHHGVAARNIQRAMIDHIANGIGLNNMTYAENTINYDGFAFGFGKKTNNNWKFYIYGSNTGVAKMGDY
jgi:hypothetical protein